MNFRVAQGLYCINYAIEIAESLPTLLDQLL